MKRKNLPDRDAPVGSFVRTRRKANRLSQRELATLAGVGMRLVSELERGKATLRIDGVNAVLRPFGKRLGVVDLPREGSDQPQPRIKEEK